MVLLQHIVLASFRLGRVPLLVAIHVHVPNKAQIDRDEEVEDDNRDFGGQVSWGVAGLERLRGDDVSDCVCYRACVFKFTC